MKKKTCEKCNCEKSESYPLIKKLGLEIVKEPYPHITVSKLNQAIIKAGLDVNKFDEYFGVNTGLVIETGEMGLYPIDIESALNKLILGKDDGHWD